MLRKREQTWAHLQDRSLFREATPCGYKAFEARPSCTRVHLIQACPPQTLSAVQKRERVASARGQERGLCRAVREPEGSEQTAVLDRRKPNDCVCKTLTNGPTCCRSAIGAGDGQKEGGGSCVFFKHFIFFFFHTRNKFTDHLLLKHLADQHGRCWPQRVESTNQPVCQRLQIEVRMS